MYTRVGEYGSVEHFIKVGWFQKDFLMSSFLPNNQRNVFKDFCLRCEICGSVSSRSQVVMKKSSNDTFFFVQKEVLGEKIIIWVKYGNIFTQIMMFSLKKVDDLRARGKRNHKLRALASKKRLDQKNKSS